MPRWSTNSQPLSGSRRLRTASRPRIGAQCAKIKPFRRLARVIIRAAVVSQIRSNPAETHPHFLYPSTTYITPPSLERSIWLSTNSKHQHNSNFTHQTPQHINTNIYLTPTHIMDYINKFTNQASGQQNTQQPTQSTQQSSSGGGLMDKLHGMAGGGPESEKKEDALDKGKSPVSHSQL